LPTPQRRPKPTKNPQKTHKKSAKNHNTFLTMDLDAETLATIVLAAYKAAESPLSQLLLQRQRRMHHLTTLLCGPTAVVKDYTPKRRLAYDPDQKFSIEERDDDWCIEFLRFTKDQVKEIAFILNIPSRFRYGIRYTPEDALALTLFRLSAPKRLKDCVEYFNRDLGWLSTVFNDVCVHIDRRYTSKLEWDTAFLTPERLEAYCEHVHANGEPSGKIWGFLDGTHRAICRPQPETADQALLWSGYKHLHTAVFQGLVTPDGLITHLKGPYEGRACDWGMLKDSGLLENLKQSSHDREGNQLWVYGDAGYGLEEGLLSSFRAQGATANREAVPLTVEQEVFNAGMARQRIVVEWGFGKVVNTFAFIDFRKKLKIGLSPVGPLIFTAFLLTNVHTCYYGSETASYFQCQPPTVWEYFGVDEANYRGSDGEDN
jgi:hypothetical protein